MTVLIHDYSKLVAVPVGEPSEALLPASVTSDIAPPGTATHVVEVVMYITIVAPTVPLTVSVRCTALTATLEAGITCPSGVTGAMVMEP